MLLCLKFIQLMVKRKKKTSGGNIKRCTSLILRSVLPPSSLFSVPILFLAPSFHLHLPRASGRAEANCLKCSGWQWGLMRKLPVSAGWLKVSSPSTLCCIQIRHPYLHILHLFFFITDSCVKQSELLLGLSNAFWNIVSLFKNAMSKWYKPVDLNSIT